MTPDFVLDEQAAEFVSNLARRQGRFGNEVAVVLAGRTAEEGVVLDRIIVPQQRAYSTEFGCGLVIDGACLNRIGPRIREDGRRIHGILHSHPDEAYHSSTDDAAVLMRFHGAFSLVIPNFGNRDHLAEDSKAYVFDYEEGWQEIHFSSLISIRNSDSFEVIYDE